MYFQGKSFADYIIEQLQQSLCLSVNN